MMMRFLRVIGLVFAFLGVAVLVSAQEIPPAPTLIPPTLVPSSSAVTGGDLLSESGLARMSRDGVARVGLFYNRPLFGELSLRGDVVGFDADLARSMVEAWGIKFQPVQVTLQNAMVLLKTGQIDFLAASQVHYRDMTDVEFSTTYYKGGQAVLVRQDDGAATPLDMAGRRLGVVLGSASETAVTSWQAQTGLSVNMQTYMTLDRGYVALIQNEIDGLVDTRVHLTDVAQPAGLAKILETDLSPEPYGIVILRQDVNLRNLINRTMQYLAQKGRMQEIQQTYFTGTKYPVGQIPVWLNTPTDEPKLDTFPQDVAYPTQPVIPQIMNTGVVRVAGLTTVMSDAPESEKRLDALNRAIVANIVERWGKQIQYVDGDPIALLASGGADLAVGVTLDWALVDRVDFSQPYLLHGDRLLIKTDSEFETFNVLGSSTFGVLASEHGAAELVQKIAESVNNTARIYTIARDQDAVDEILYNDKADVVFADSLKLIPLLETYAGQVKLGKRGDAPDPFYSRVYVGLAVPRNDLDFRLLVDYTLQDMAVDGTLQQLLTGLMQPEDVPAFDVWPGARAPEFLGRLGAGSGLVG